MKATELMIGDWVYYKYSAPKSWEPRKWQVVAFESGLIELTDPNTACKPIPITPEILERNGFELKSRWWILNSEYFFFLIQNEYDYYSIVIGRLSVPCSYIHQLQHALRLCGLDELADNFEV